MKRERIVKIVIHNVEVNGVRDRGRGEKLRMRV